MRRSTRNEIEYLRGVVLNIKERCLHLYDGDPGHRLLLGCITLRGIYIIEDTRPIPLIGFDHFWEHDKEESCMDLYQSLEPWWRFAAAILIGH